MIKQKTISIFLMIALASFIGKAQVSIVNIQLMPYNVTPQGMISATIMNTGVAQQVEIVSSLYNSNNELLLTVKTSPFNLKQGVNAPDGSRKISDAEYSSNNQANYIKTTHGLSSGAFKVCVDVISMKTSEPVDQYCDELESDYNQYLYLVYPTNNDSIETTTPLLIWTHNEPFNLTSQTNYFRMLVSEIKGDQSPEEAVVINTPLLGMNYLTTHTLQYPFDAPLLVKGKEYAWQVQQISNGTIINKTEAWKFSIILDRPVPDNKYASLKKVLDAGYYTAENDKLFFKFEEEYIAGNITCTIFNSKRKAIQPKAKNEGVNTNSLNYKQNGYNRYEINLNELDIKKGFYTLEAKSEKGELFLLKFYVQ